MIFLHTYSWMLQNFVKWTFIVTEIYKGRKTTWNTQMVFVFEGEDYLQNWLEKSNGRLVMYIWVNKIISLIILLYIQWIFFHPSIWLSLRKCSLELCTYYVIGLAIYKISYVYNIKEINKDYRFIQIIIVELFSVWRIQREHWDWLFTKSVRVFQTKLLVLLKSKYEEFYIRVLQ